MRSELDERLTQMALVVQNFALGSLSARDFERQYADFYYYEALDGHEPSSALPSRELSRLRYVIELHQFNRYRYANGNLYKFTDPDGRQAAERFVERHRKDVAAGNGSEYEPLRPVAVAVTAAMAASVMIEIGMALVSNPGAISAGTSIAADMAGVTGAGGAGLMASKALSAEGRVLAIPDRSAVH